MLPIFIYALNDPNTGQHRYVGKTGNPDARLASHLASSHKGRRHLACWIRSLLKAGLKPVMEILDVVPDSEWEFWEREYIQNFQERGFDLTNDSAGGRGGSLGHKDSFATRAKKREARLGNKNPFFGKTHPPEVMAKIIAANVGRVESLETRARKRTASLGNTYRRGKKSSAATCAKVSEATKGNRNPMFGRKHTPEAIAKMSANRKGK